MLVTQRQATNNKNYYLKKSKSMSPFKVCDEDESKRWRRKRFVIEKVMDIKIS